MQVRQPGSCPSFSVGERKGRAAQDYKLKKWKFFFRHLYNILIFNINFVLFKKPTKGFHACSIVSLIASPDSFAFRLDINGE